MATVPSERDLRRMTAAYQRLFTDDTGLSSINARDNARILWAVAHGSSYRQAESVLDALSRRASAPEER
jgi:hypothetical protein